MNCGQKIERQKLREPAGGGYDEKVTRRKDEGQELQLPAFRVARGGVDGRSLARDELHGKKSARARACPITDLLYAHDVTRRSRSAGRAIGVRSTAVWAAGAPRERR